MYFTQKHFFFKDFIRSVWLGYIGQYDSVLALPVMESGDRQSVDLSTFPCAALKAFGRESNSSKTSIGNTTEPATMAEDDTE